MRLSAKDRRRWRLNISVVRKLKKEKKALKVEKKDLQHQLEEARPKVKAEVERSAKVEDWGYQRGYDESTEFFRDALVTLAPEAFRIEGYFASYVKFVEDRWRAEAQG